MSVNAEHLKYLRTKTGAGMADCLGALTDCGGDVLAAESLLRVRGLAEAGKRAEKATREGRIFLSSSGTIAAMVELRCETDFVAMNSAFLEAGRAMVASVLHREREEVTEEMGNVVSSLVALFKENIRLGRLALRRASADERIETYVHGEGRVGVILAARTAGSNTPGSVELVHDLALQIAAFKPLFLDLVSVPPSYRTELGESIRKEVEEDEVSRGKDATIRERMLEGRIRKRLAAVCLAEQGYLRDEKRKVREVLASARESCSCLVEPRDFVRFGIDDEEAGHEASLSPKV